MDTTKLNGHLYVLELRYAHSFSIRISRLFAAPQVVYIGLGAFFCVPDHNHLNIMNI